MARSFTTSTDIAEYVGPKQPPNVGSVAFWFKPNWNAGESTDRMLFEWSTSPREINFFHFEKWNDNNCYIGWYSSGTENRIVIADSAVFSSGVWGHHIVDYDNSSGEHYYLNNVLKGSKTTTGFVVTVNGYLSIGRSAGIPDDDCNGTIGYFAQWDVVLTPDERAALAAGALPSSPRIRRPVVCNYPFDGLSSPELDWSGNFQSLTLTGTTYADDPPQMQRPGFDWLSAISVAGSTPVSEMGTLEWNLRKIVNEPGALEWNLRKLVNEPSTLEWNLNAHVSANSTLEWSLRKAVLEAATLEWNLRKLVAQLGTLEWSLNSRVSNPGTLEWSLAGKVGSQSTLEWSLRKLVAEVQTLEWNLRNSISNPATLKWNLQAIVSQLGTLEWSLRKLASQLSTLEWDIGSVITVSNLLTLEWSLRQLVADVQTLKWNLNAHVLQPSSLQWNLRQLVVKNATLQWNLRTAISQEITYLWALRQHAAGNSNLQWSISGRINALLHVMWSIGDSFLLDNAPADLINVSFDGYDIQIPFDNYDIIPS
jgi:regulator of replication initiation timing